MSLDSQHNSSTNNVQDQFDAYVEGLLALKGLDDMPRDAIEYAKRDIASELDEFLVTKMIDAVPDDELQEFEQTITDDGPTQASRDIIEQHIPDMETFIAQALVEFKSLYVG